MTLELCVHNLCIHQCVVDWNMPSSWDNQEYFAQNIFCSLRVSANPNISFLFNMPLTFLCLFSISFPITNLHSTLTILSIFGDNFCFGFLCSHQRQRALNLRQAGEEVKEAERRWRRAKIKTLIYGFPLGRGDVPRFRIICGERFGDLSMSPLQFSLSGDGDDPPPDAELRRDDPIFTSKWRKRRVVESSALLELNKNANGHEIHDDSLQREFQQFNWDQVRVLRK